MTVGDPTIVWTILGFLAVAVIAVGVWWLAQRARPAPPPDTSAPAAPTLLIQSFAVTPTSSPTETSAPDGPFADSFDGNSNKWPTGSAAYIQDGAYHLFGSDRSALVWNSNREWSDFHIAVDLSIAPDSNDTGAAGLLLRVGGGQAGSSYYAYLIDAEGRPALGRVSDNNWAQLAPWSDFAGPFERNGSNHVEVYADGSKLELVINGVSALSMQDDLLASGWIGFIADAGIHAVFDNLSVENR